MNFWNIDSVSLSFLGMRLRWLNALCMKSKISFIVTFKKKKIELESIT